MKDKKKFEISWKHPILTILDEQENTLLKLRTLSTGNRENVALVELAIGNNKSTKQYIMAERNELRQFLQALYYWTMK